MAMTVGGVENIKETAHTKPYVIARGTLPNGEPRLLAFIAQPIWSFQDFRDRCPVPELPATCVKFTSKGKVADNRHPEYIALLVEHGRQQWGYTILKSLEPSQIVFDGISLADPTTWGGVETALKEELGHYAFARVMRLVDEAQGIDEDKLEENRQTFFRQSSPASTGNTPPDDQQSSS
jgi:hypothetical protein